MGVITLNVYSDDRQAKKAMQFEPSMLVFDACKIIREKMGLQDTNAQEYGLFRREDDPTRCVWMDNGRPLEHYLIRNQDSIEYKRKIRMLKVRMMDGAIKTIAIDESQPVKQIMFTVCSKIGISNSEEWSLVREQQNLNGRSINDLRAQKLREQDGYGTKDRNIPLSGTIGRSKEKKMEQLRQKLQTDDELNWVDHDKTLREQGIEDDETLLLRRKFFYNDSNVDTRDPVQLNLLYVQCRDGILRGLHPVSKEIATELGALQCQVQYGDFPENKPKFYVEGRDVLPKEYAKKKENEERVVQMYKELRGTNQLDAMSKYVHMCRGLHTYGVTFFLVKQKLPGKNKLVPRLLGVTKDSVLSMDEKTKEVLKEYPLEQVRKWAPSPRTFSLDLGDYADGFFTVQTLEGEKIAHLIGGYIDIILKKRKIPDHLGIEGDEGSTMLEDVVAPARATLVSHGQIGAGQHAHDGRVAIPGVLRSAASSQGYGINGAQYGAVSGQITSQQVTRSQRGRIEDPKERAQRALIGTIEATVRAVEEAEEELEREPQIELPRFPDDPASRRLMDDKIEVGKERVNERLAAMGAATAQVVQWTAIKEEYDDRVGPAIATIGSNMPEVGRDVRDLAVYMPEEKRGDLIDATKRLCGAFGDFLQSVNPEHDENRTTVLAAASRVGDYSRNVITTIEEETTIQTTFTDGLMQRAKDVASSTAHLVQRSKTIATACKEPELQDRVIQSATKTAFATSQLVACTRIVAPTIDSDACQSQLTSAAKEVARTVEQLLVDAQSACEHDPNPQTARTNLTDIHEAARQVTRSLDGLLGHIKGNPKNARDEQMRSDEYERLLRSSNQLITHTGPTQELVRQGEKVIRHSQILVEEFEREAEQRPENKKDLLDAARRVANATSAMIDATRECESRPDAAQSQMALRSATERLAETTTEVTSEHQSQRTMHELEQAAKQVAYNATQTIAAASACKDAPPPPAHRRQTTTHTTTSQEEEAKENSLHIRIERAPQHVPIAPTRETRVERRMTPQGGVVTTTTISETRQMDDIRQPTPDIYYIPSPARRETTVTTTTSDYNYRNQGVPVPAARTTTTIDSTDIYRNQNIMPSPVPAARRETTVTTTTASDYGYRGVPSPVPLRTTTRQDVGEVESFGRGVYRNVSIGPDGVARTTTTTVDSSGMRDVVTNLMELPKTATSSRATEETSGARTVNIQMPHKSAGLASGQEFSKKPRLETKKHKEEVEQLLIDDEHTVYTVPIKKT